MSEIIKLTVALTIVCLISGAIIVFTHSSTIKKIEAQKLLEQKSAFQEVFPPNTDIFDTTGTAPLPSQFWISKSGSVITGFGFIVENRGYSGIIKFIVGIDTLGTILGIKILGQTETPGLGERMAERVSGKSILAIFKKNTPASPPWFTEQFKGLSVSKPLSITKTSEWPNMTDLDKRANLESNAVSAITGATLSTQAVLWGIKKNVAPYFAALKGSAQ